MLRVSLDLEWEQDSEIFVTGAHGDSVTHLAVILPISGSWPAARQEQTMCFSVNPQFREPAGPSSVGLVSAPLLGSAVREAPTMPLAAPRALDVARHQKGQGVSVGDGKPWLSASRA